MVAMSLIAMAMPTLAQEGTEAGLKEIQLVSGTFTRGAPVPAWADLAPTPQIARSTQAMVVLLTDTHFRATDTQAWLSHRVTQANDSSTLGRLGQVALHFNPAYQTLALHRLEVIRDGGVIDHTATAPVRFLQRETQLEQGVYNGVITASLVLPDIRVGDALRLVYSVEGRNPILGSRYTEGASWGETVPVLHRRVTLLAPADRRIAWRLIGDGPADRPPNPVETVKDGVRRTVFEARDLAAVDIEPNLPVHARPVHWLQFSEYSSWSEVGQWAADLFRLAAPLPAQMEPVLSGLRALPNEDARASEALRWVQDNIRYHSVVLGESSHRPHAPAEVLDNRYGDCKDKSLLLVSMLRALGLEADPVLASLEGRRNMSGMLPSPDLFDHVVVRVQVNGDVHFIDPTRTGQVGALARMGQHLEDAEVLLARADSSGPVVVRSALREELFHNVLQERFTLDSFDRDGRLEMQLTVNGLVAEGYRAALPRMDHVQRKQWALSGFEKRYPGLELVSGPSFADDATRNRITIQAAYRVPKLAREGKDYWVVNYQPVNLYGSVVIPERITRRLPVAVPSYPAVLEYEVLMRWPESVGGMQDPTERTVDTPFFRARVSSNFRGREARRKVVFQALVGEVQAGELTALLDSVRQLDQAVGSGFVVDRSQIKRAGVLGIGRQTAMDKLREQLENTVKGAGRAIAGGQLQGEDLVEALCARAEAQSDLGKPELGLGDAEKAVEQGPGLARAWDCRGVLNFSSARFDQAVSDYSRFLALGGDAFHGLYRRGIARYYQGQLAKAAEDFARASAARDDDGDRLYVRLWQAWTLRQLGLALPDDLAKAAAADTTGAWPRPALALQAGLLTPEQMMAEVNKKTGDDLHMTLAEAWFYVGQYHKSQGAGELAAEAFRNVRSKQMTVYNEHVAAGFELNRPTGGGTR